jgi:hypothetical protein
MTNHLYAVVENAGYEGEHAVKFSRDIRLCIGWMTKHYTQKEISDLHVDIALQREDGTRTYDF